MVLTGALSAARPAATAAIGGGGSCILWHTAFRVLVLDWDFLKRSRSETQMTISTDCGEAL